MTVQGLSVVQECVTQARGSRCFSAQPPAWEWSGHGHTHPHGHTHSRMHTQTLSPVRQHSTLRTINSTGNGNRKTYTDPSVEK